MKNLSEISMPQYLKSAAKAVKQMEAGTSWIGFLGGFLKIIDRALFGITVVSALLTYLAFDTGRSDAYKQRAIFYTVLAMVIALILHAVNRPRKWQLKYQNRYFRKRLAAYTYIPPFCFDSKLLQTAADIARKQENNWGIAIMSVCLQMAANGNDDLTWQIGNMPEEFWKRTQYYFYGDKGFAAQGPI